MATQPDLIDRARAIRSLYTEAEADYIDGSPYTPPPVDPIPVDAVGETSGKVLTADLADLMVLRTKTKRYELGAIAHIENVMMGETFSRTFRRREGTEITELGETERTETNERDLQSTTKHELKNEVEKTIKESMEVEAGLTVAVHGPGVDVTAEGSFGYDRSSEEITKAATNYAREVVDRTVSRIQERALERRTIVSTRSIEETSIHELSGVGQQQHNIGIYRWVDKIDEAQVVNYGRRMMVEVVVPEPAAFYLFALANKGSPVAGAVQPELPLVWDRAKNEARELRVSDIDEANYLLWVSRYNVTGVSLPPPEYKYISTAIELKREMPPAAEPPTDPPTDPPSPPPPKTDLVSARPAGTLTVDPGYEATEFVAIGTSDYSEFIYSGLEGLVIHVGGSTAINQRNDPVLLHTWHIFAERLEGSIPVSISGHHTPSAVVNILVTTQRTERALDDWRIKVFASIMAKYNQLQAEYEDQLAAASIQEGVQISGRNPLANREIERNELKKLAMTMMTGQHFDSFNAMKGPDETHVFPQVSVEEADYQAFGVKLLEQAFEWHYMMYVFYPYYWGSKKRWIDLLNLEDVDPVFARFLRAGAARIQIPVRPGFEHAVDYVIATGFPYGSAEMHITEDGVSLSGLRFLSIIQELMEQTGLAFETGPGTVSVTQGSTTVTGVGTEFLSESDILSEIEIRPELATFLATTDREIKIAGQVYRVRSVASPTELTLWTAYEGPTATGLPYSLGPRLVGEPWEVRLPTTLVMLQGRESELNYPPV